jgi:hypothetical protein
MTTIVIIKEAILALGDRTGSSVPAITKWIETNKKVCLLQKLSVYSSRYCRLCIDAPLSFVKKRNFLDGARICGGQYHRMEYSYDAPTHFTS